MVSPIGGRPQEPFPSETSFPGTWSKQINTIDNCLIERTNEQAIKDLNELIQSIENYRPQSPKFAAAIQSLEQSKEFATQGHNMEAINALYKALDILKGLSSK